MCTTLVSVVFECPPGNGGLADGQKGVKGGLQNRVYPYPISGSATPGIFLSIRIYSGNFAARLPDFAGHFPGGRGTEYM